MDSKLLLTKSIPKFSIEYNRSSYVYYMLNERPYTYLCLCEAGFSKYKCLTFLKDIREQFVRTFTDEQRGVAIAHGLSKHFETVMKDRMVVILYFYPSKTL